MKFSIRDLLLVTMIVALAVGWWADHYRIAEENERLERAESQWHVVANSLADAMKENGWKVEINADTNGPTWRMESPDEMPNSQAPAPSPPKKSVPTYGLTPSADPP